MCIISDSVSEGKRRATQNFWHIWQQRKQSAHWEMVRLGDGTVLRRRGWEMVTVRKDTGMEEHVVFLDFHCGKWIPHSCTHTLN